ncbi:DUF1707 SHOCT-like domain-containing protein [Streptosporangium carneum]|uniref:DUF1707 domain-containing protein n=1 Tax=Streptosporangium carneum TaxID=47481 RepID=A0A9W6I9X3_9ACTN|nr:DUF1707 domain-containing protein [Streptosporangium carneum]GLK14121.1 hypothetical protein GCM10017600_75330 [Streptosporangium carneum]
MTFPDDLRIGDAERDAAMDALREHYAQGRLTHEELDERLELVLSARTGRDLAAVGADLPDPYGTGLNGHGGLPGGGEEYGEQWDHAWSRHHRHREELEERRRRRRHGQWAPHPASWHDPAAWHHSAPWGKWDNPAVQQLVARKHAEATQRAMARHQRRMSRRMGHRGGPSGFPLVVALIAVVAIAGFWTFKFLLLPLLVLAVAGMFHRRRRHHRMYAMHAHAHGRRINHPGAF